MLINVLLLIQAKGHRESSNEAGSQSLEERVSGFWTGILQFWEWRAISLSYSHVCHEMYLMRGEKENRLASMGDALKLKGNSSFYRKDAKNTTFTKPLKTVQKVCLICTK